MLKTSILAFVFILGCRASLPTGEKYDRGVIGGASLQPFGYSVDFLLSQVICKMFKQAFTRPALNC